jgi:hypothetical protein
MNHFALEQWADFVRNVGPRQDRELMAQHVTACTTCATTVLRLSQAATCAAADARYEPPSWLLRHARALFALERPRLMERLPGVPGRLIFDTLAQPLTAAVRGSADLNRHTVFEAGAYAVDLKIEHTPRMRDATVVGQVISREAGSHVASAPVSLIAGRIRVAATVSNESGEFLLQYTPRPDLQLQIAIENGTRRIDIDMATGTTREGRMRRARPFANRVRRASKPNATK